MPVSPEQGGLPEVNFAWLEITNACQLRCVHCYAESGPDGGHGSMTESNWQNTIAQLVEAGAQEVQFIGGEPTLNPALPGLISYVLSRDVRAEVYSNLSYISPAMWDTLSQDGVRMATSYYSPNFADHQEITKGRGSHGRTRANIIEATRRGIPLRVGIVAVSETQDVEGAVRELTELGVQPDRIGVDRLRQVGRGIRDKLPDADQFCGRCANGVIAVGNNGDLRPCVFARGEAFTAGNVTERSVLQILAGERFGKIRKALNSHFGARVTGCGPDVCNPDWGCAPSTCRP